MKYRRLRKEELEELEKDFVQFLASQQIPAEDWEKLKKEDNDKAEGLIDIFSDEVFDKVCSKVEYLEYKEKNDIKTFHCQKEKITMMGLFVEGESDLDFTVSMTSEEMMNQLRSSTAQLKIYTAEKAYKGEKKEEIFRMLEGGCLISKDGSLYKTLFALRGN